MKSKRFVAVTAIALRIVFLQTLLILVVNTYAYYNAAEAQGILDKVVSVSIEKGQIKEVFNQLQNQTGARFVYSSKTIEAGRKVSIKAMQKKLGEVLEELLSPFGISFKLVKDRIILYKSSSSALADPPGLNVLPVKVEPGPLQEVKGQVTDDKGNPLPGVSVLVKGTSTGTNTDMNGNFTINVPQGNAVLVISSVGFTTQEVNLTEKTTITIALVAGNTGQLGEIVV